LYDEKDVDEVDVDDIPIVKLEDLDISEGASAFQLLLTA
jgi:hypothetical protein